MQRNVERRIGHPLDERAVGQVRRDKRLRVKPQPMPASAAATVRVGLIGLTMLALAALPLRGALAGS